MNQEILESLLERARKDLISYPKTGIKRKAKNIAKTMIGKGKDIPERDYISWPNGLLALAIEDCDPGDAAIDSFFNQWVENGSKIRSVEDAVSGLAFLRKDGDKYEEAAKKMYEYLVAAPQDELGSFLYNSKQDNKYVLVDMIGMVCPFLSLYGRKYSCNEAFEIAETQILNFVKHGMDDETLLPYHGYEISSDSKLGIVGWGRAVGWLMMGEAGYLACAPKNRANYGIIENQFKITIDTICKYQNKSDLFEWKLDIFSKEIDTSASAMILDSVATYLIAKTQEDSGFSRYKELVVKGASALEKYIKNGAVYGAQAECLGLGMHPDKYGAYPWSLGPTLSLIKKLKLWI